VLYTIVVCEGFVDRIREVFFLAAVSEQISGSGKSFILAAVSEQKHALKQHTFVTGFSPWNNNNIDNNNIVTDEKDNNEDTNYHRSCIHK